jgi:hypothetical protein
MFSQSYYKTKQYTLAGYLKVLFRVIQKWKLAYLGAKVIQCYHQCTA